MELTADNVLTEIRKACMEFRLAREQLTTSERMITPSEMRYAELVGMVQALDYTMTHGLKMPVTWTRTKVIVNEWSAKCAHCGGNANHQEPRHYHGGPRGMYEPGSSMDDTNGCGAIFESIITVEIVPG